MKFRLKVIEVRLVREDFLRIAWFFGGIAFGLALVMIVITPSYTELVKVFSLIWVLPLLAIANILLSVVCCFFALWADE